MVTSYFKIDTHEYVREFETSKWDYRCQMENGALFRTHPIGYLILAFHCLSAILQLCKL